MELVGKKSSEESEYLSKSYEDYVKTLQHLLASLRKKIQTSHTAYKV